MEQGNVTTHELREILHKEVGVFEIPKQAEVGNHAEDQPKLAATLVRSFTDAQGAEVVDDAGGGQQ